MDESRRVFMIAYEHWINENVRTIYPYISIHMYVESGVEATVCYSRSIMFIGKIFGKNMKSFPENVRKTVALDRFNWIPFYYVYSFEAFQWNILQSKINGIAFFFRKQTANWMSRELDVKGCMETACKK